MKKRIIAALLVLVMTVLALASCGFDLAEDDLSVYTEGEFDIAKFMAELKKIDIEDGEYTTDKATNDKIIASDIYVGIANGLITSIGTAGKDDDADGKLEDGTIGANDVVYYCYYITYSETKDGNTVVHQFKRSELNEATMSASATKNSHVINMGEYNEKDSFAKALVAALKDKELKAYSMDSTKNAVKATDVICISYTVKGTGEGAITEKASYEFLDLNDTENALATALKGYIGKPGTTFKVGEAKVLVPTAEYSETNKTTTNKITVGDKEYSDIKVEYVVDKMGEEITFEYKLESSLGTLAYDELHNTAGTTSKLLDKDTTVTYHILPVYRLDVPASSASALVEYVYGSKLSTLLTTPSSSFAYGSSINRALNELLADEEYKNDTKTAKDLTDTLAKLWKEDFSDEAFASLKTLADAVKTANEAVDAAIKAKNDAPAADKPAKEEEIVKAEEALEKAEADLDKALKEAIRAEIAKLIAAKKGDKVLGDEMMKTLDEDLRHSRKEAYDSDISSKIGKAVYKLIGDMVKVTSYPDDLVKEFYDHLYDSYEYTFYNGNYSSTSSTTGTQSNFSHFGGDFNAFLKETLKKAGFLTSDLEAQGKKGIKAAITAEAKTYVEPLIKIYVVAQALDSYDFGGKTADAMLTEFVQMDIDAKLPSYTAYYFKNDDISDKENKKLEDKLLESAEAAREAALENAEHFLLDKEGFKAFKKRLGSKSYRYQEQQYGEVNLRANLQVTNLFDLLLSTNMNVEVDEEEEHVHSEVKYIERDGKLFHDYRLIEYKVH